MFIQMVTDIRIRPCTVLAVLCITDATDEQWGCSRVVDGWNIAGYLANLPIRAGQHIVSSLLCVIEATLLIAGEILSELRHLGIRELLCVLMCLLRGEPLSSLSVHDTSASHHLHVNNPTFSRAASLGSSHSFRSASDLFCSGSDISGTESRFGYGFGIGGSSSFGFVPADRDPILLRQQTELRTKLDRINRTASLISYQELKGGPRTMHLSRSRAERVKRMMHYDIPLRPFHATVMVDTHSISPIDNIHGSNSGGGLSPISEPFMCTPQSFPPTPISRACVMVSHFSFTTLL
jgi:hypothetical protein